MDVLQFFTMPDGRVGFRGMVNGRRRVILAATFAKLFAFIEDPNA
jgi:hypothetical protein